MLVLLGYVGAIQPAMAENRSASQSVWVIAQDRVTLRIVLPAEEARQLRPRGLPPPSTEQVASYVLDRVSVSASGTRCPAIDQGYDIGRIDILSVGAGLYGFEIIFQCPSSQDLILRNAVLFERVPQHVDFARIEQNGAVVAQLFTSGRQDLHIPAAGAAAVPAGGYVRLGISHIRNSLDRVCFLAGLLILVRNRRDFLRISGGLLLGYFASTIVSASGYAIPNMPAAEAGLGFLVALIAAQSIAWEARRRGVVAGAVGAVMMLVGVATLLLRAGQIAWLPFGLGLFAASLLRIGELRWLPIVVLPAIFGFLDGLVLPGDYAKLQLWHQLSFARLMAFNAGALLAGAALVGSLFAAALLFRRLKLSLPRAAMQDLAATALAGLGAFWMLSAVLAN